MTAKATQQTKRFQRKLRNLEGKRVLASQRHRDLIALGESLIKTEVDGPEVDGKPTKVVKYELPEPISQSVPSNPPHLIFVGMKQFRHSGKQGKTRPGNKEFHAAAVIEDAKQELKDGPTVNAINSGLDDTLPL